MNLRATVVGLVLGSACSGCSGATDRLSRPEPPATAGETTWAAWEKATFERAATERRIILINVVATWCHWCHVMEEETYANPKVAALLRDHFVTIRIDSDARPDIAERYRAWGWPATAVLSPDARPILELRGFQKPAEFEALLRELVAERDAGTLTRRGEIEAPPRPTDADLTELRARATRQLDEFYDDKRGGWGRNQKYPFPGQMEHALLRAKLHGDASWTDRATFTLAGWERLIDPVWGGIYQYSLQASWDHPHYEKITAIQGGAIFNFALATRMTGDARWVRPARAVAGYMAEFMRAGDGGYFTSQDADLRRPGRPAVLGADYYALDDEQRRALGLPRIDANVYADLTGHMIRGLAELYVATGDSAALDDAVAAATRLLRTHRTERGGFVHGEDDDPDGLLHLQDQAVVGLALLSLYRATADARWLAEAGRLATFMAADLQDAEPGGFFGHTQDPEAVGVFALRRKPVQENGFAARMFVALHRYHDGDGTEKTAYYEPARRALLAVGDEQTLRAEGRIVGAYLLALEEITMATVDITVVGDGSDAATRALYTAASRYPEPRGVLEVSAPGERYPDIGTPAVYFCTESACSTPMTDAAQLATKADTFLATALPSE